jgi:uncharacterized protein with PIN domain
MTRATIAGRAWRVFGRAVRPGRGNLGDGVADALAKQTCEPRLFNANGFAHTDVEPALKD